MKNRFFSIAIVLVGIGLATTPAMAREMRDGAMSHRPVVEARGSNHGPRVEKRVAVRHMSPSVRPSVRPVVHPSARPIGMRLSARPAGIALSFGGVNFIYDNGVFYSVLGRSFEVIRPSVGMIVPSLPVGHTVIMRNNIRHFAHNGILYRPLRNGSSIVYRVEGFI